MIESPGVELERLVRYCHPAKILATTRLPGALDDAAVASLYGTSAAGWRALADDLGSRARAAADDLAGDDSVERVALAAGDAIVALGDSHTDDLASWAAILGHLLPVPVVNAGLSGDTTTGARARLDALPAATIAVVLLGTNDARRHGRDGVPMLVSHDETARNLGEIGAALRRRGARVLWVTPPPVDERRIRAHPDTAGLEWRLDDVAAKADLVRALDPACVDLWPGFDARHLEPDGLHPSALGQRLIAERVLAALAAMAPR